MSFGILSVLLLRISTRSIQDDHRYDQKQQYKVPNKVPNKVPDKLKMQYPEVSDACWNVYLQIKANSHATTDEIGQSLSISDRMVRKHIATLRGAQLIERIGGNKTGYWKVNK